MLRTLPDDDVRAITWRFADRSDLHKLVQSARAVARGPVARLVARGGRNSHEWTEEKAELLTAFDQAGLSRCACTSINQQGINLMMKGQLAGLMKQG